MEVALDVGGSSIKSGLVEDGRLIDDISVTPLDHAASAGDLVGSFVTAIAAHATADRVAIACPAPFDYEQGISLMRHKFATLYQAPLSSWITEELGRSVEIRWCNDATAVVVGEAVAGAGRGHRRVLGITLGTGLGAAFVDDGAEVVSYRRLVVGDLYRERVDRDRIADDVFSARALMQQIAESPDADIDVVMERFGTELGSFLAPVVEELQADLLVVGGGGTGSFDGFGPALRASIPVPVEVAQLGRAAPLLGAALLCFPRTVRPQGLEP